MASFHFELVSPERLLFAGEVEQVVVPGSEGEFTVLRDHAPLMTTLRPGIVRVDGGAGGAQRLFGGKIAAFQRDRLLGGQPGAQCREGLGVQIVPGG